MIEQFNKYVMPKTNIIAETCIRIVGTETRRDKRVVHSCASADRCECEFGNTKSERIRDRLISGMLNKELARKIQIQALDTDITLEKHPDVFGATGLMQTSPNNIELADGAIPAAVTTARGVPLPLMKQVKEKLERMENNGIIQLVTEPTDWCATMVR